MQQFKAQLLINVKYSDFSLNPAEVESLLSKNTNYLINRGSLTEESSLVVETYDVEVSSQVAGQILSVDVNVSVHYEGDSSVEEIKSILKGFADEMSNRGLLTQDWSVEEYSSEVVAQEK